MSPEIIHAEHASVVPVARRRGPKGRHEVLVDGRWLPEADVTPEAITRPLVTNGAGPITRRQGIPASQEEEPMPTHARDASPEVDRSPRPCVVCGATFTPDNKGKPAVACSPEHRLEHRRRYDREKKHRQVLARQASRIAQANGSVDTANPSARVTGEPAVDLHVAPEFVTEIGAGDTAATATEPPITDAASDQQVDLEELGVRVMAGIRGFEEGYAAAIDDVATGQVLERSSSNGHVAVESGASRSSMDEPTPAETAGAALVLRQLLAIATTELADAAELMRDEVDGVFVESVAVRRWLRTRLSELA